MTEHPAFLLVLLAACWGAARALPGGGEDRWETRIDLPLALGVGVAVALLSALWFARFHLTGWPLTASDFDQYCTNTQFLRQGTREGWFTQRSLFAALLPGALARPLGVMGGLAAGATISMGLMAAGVFLWARAVLGRVAGISAALLLVACGPAVVLVRTATFYPEIVASTTLCAATTACALRWRSLATLGIASVAVGWVMLIDPRGLPTAMTCGALLLLAAVVGSWRSLPLRLGLLVLPICCSWWVASVWTPEGTNGLASQVFSFLTGAIRHSDPTTLHQMPVEGVSAHVIPNPMDIDAAGKQADFVWGRDNLESFLAMLHYVATARSHAPEGLSQTPWFVEERAKHIVPWLAPMGASVLLVIARLKLRPWHLLCVLGLIVPAVLSVYAASMTHPRPRFLSQGAVVAPLLLGLAVGAAVGARPRLPVALGAVALVVGVVFGVPKTWLSPEARWRWSLAANAEPRVFQQGENEGPCKEFIAQDQEDGFWQPYGTGP